MFLQLNLISAAFGFLFFISGFGLVNGYVWRDVFGMPQWVLYFIVISLWVAFQVLFFKVAKNRLVGSYWLLLSAFLWLPYLLIWSFVISSVIPEGVLQDRDDYGAGLLLLFVSIFVYPIYAGGVVSAAIMRARRMRL